VEESKKYRAKRFLEMFPDKTWAVVQERIKKD